VWKEESLSVQGSTKCRVEVVREGNGVEEASVNVEDSCRPHRLFRAEGMKGREGKGREGYQT
jgi:hypothetical protein